MSRASLSPGCAGKLSERMFCRFVNAKAAWRTNGGPGRVCKVWEETAKRRGHFLVLGAGGAALPRQLAGSASCTVSTPVRCCVRDRAEEPPTHR